MRRNRWTAWWVMAWLALSLAVANASPLMSSGGALVCSASGTKWVEYRSEPTANSAQKHTWHCSLCLPFVAGGDTSVVPLQLAGQPQIWVHHLTQAISTPVARPYLARAPPSLVRALAAPV